MIGRVKSGYDVDSKFVMILVVYYSCIWSELSAWSVSMVVA